MVGYGLKRVPLQEEVSNISLGFIGRDGGVCTVLCEWTMGAVVLSWHAFKDGGDCAGGGARIRRQPPEGIGHPDPLHNPLNKKSPVPSQNQASEYTQRVFDQSRIAAILWKFGRLCEPG